jgi:hypothetical protein
VPPKSPVTTHAKADQELAPARRKAIEIYRFMDRLHPAPEEGRLDEGARIEGGIFHRFKDARLPADVAADGAIHLEEGARQKAARR